MERIYLLIQIGIKAHRSADGCFAMQEPIMSEISDVDHNGFPPAAYKTFDCLGELFAEEYVKFNAGLKEHISSK